MQTVTIKSEKDVILGSNSFGKIVLVLYNAAHINFMIMCKSLLGTPLHIGVNARRLTAVVI